MMAMINKKIIKITLDQSECGKVSLKGLCSRLEQSFDLADVNLKIELLSDVKIYLIDDLIDFSVLSVHSKIDHKIEIVLNDASSLEYRMVLKLDLDSNKHAEASNCVLDKRLNINFVGEGAHAKVRIKNMCSGHQKVNFYTEQNHLKSNTSSCLCIKAVLMNNSLLNCQNKIFVAEKLDGVFARQINKNLLLDSSADVFTQPQLEVLSDNVKCKHGASVKSLDDDQLFYLNLRGLNLDESKKLLVEGFLS